MVEHVVIPDPEHLVPLLDQELRASGISRALTCMMATVQLYKESLGWTTEIHNVRTDGVLATKLRVVDLAVAQPAPEDAFTVGLALSKPSRLPPGSRPLTLTLSP